jgi:hypothetical protein
MKVSTLPGGGTHKTLHLQLQVIRNIGLGRSGGQAVSAVEGKARPSFLKKRTPTFTRPRSPKAMRKPRLC